MTSLPDPIDNPEALLQTRDARGVVRLTLNRPDVRNAFDEPLIALIRRTFEALAQDDSVRVIVLDAVGSLFCAGADIGWMRRAAARDQAANLEDARQFAAMMHAMASCPTPWWHAFRARPTAVVSGWLARQTLPLPATRRCSASAKRALASCPPSSAPMW